MRTLRRWLILFSLALFSGTLRAQNAGPVTALNLDGVSGYAQASNGVWFSGDFTVEGWVFVRSYNSWSRLIDFADGPNTNNVFLALTAGTTGFPVFGVYTNNNGTPSIQATNQLPLNQWTHLAATLKGTTGTIYLNGIPVASGTLNLPPNVVRTNNYIGRSNYGNDTNANALFDDLRIWNVARTQTQLQAFMHRSLVGNESGLLAYWRMDDAVGSTLMDSTANGNNATLFGGTSWSNSAAPLMAGAGSALNFIAASNQFVNITNQPALNAFPITVMTWFKATSGNGALVNKYTSASFSGYQLFLAGGQLKAWYFIDSANNVYNNGPLTAGVVNDGLWHHAAMVVDTNGGRLYLDGSLKSSLAWTGTPGPTTTGNSLLFGQYPGDSSISGQLDEVSLWNTALTTAQIQSAMNHPLAGNEPGLIGYWPLNENGGTNTLDVTGHGFNGKLFANPAWVSSGAPLVLPDPGYAVNLNGTGSFLQVSNGVWFNGPFTIEGWVYTRSYNNWSRLLDFGNGQFLQDVYLALSGGNGGLPTMGIFNGDGSAPLVSSTNQLPLNQWAHLACTYDGNNGAIYINGVLSGSGPLPVGPPNVVRTNNYLGRSAFPQDAFANAIIDDVRIWNVARTPSQIKTFMSRPLSGAEPGLIGYWRFDDDAGTNAVDGSGRGNTATLVSNAVWTVSGATVNLAARLTILPAINVTAISATLQAMVDPNGSSTAIYFAYGTNLSYGFTNFLPNIGNGIGPILVTNNISGLLAGVVYHFQVVASNSFGFVTNADQIFLATDPPAVTTLPATDITSTTATLNGAINPFGADVSAWFQYGLTTNYDNLTTPTFVSGTNQSAVSISNLVSGLYPGLPYHFRLVGSNSNIIVMGADLTLTPPALPPGIDSQAANSISSQALLSANISANGADTVAWFQFGTTTNYGSTTLSTNISGTNLFPQPFFAWASNLSYGVVYHFQTIASNADGVSYGGDQLFATPLFGQTGTALPSVFWGGTAWGDFNNDGLMDVVISGARNPSAGNPITQVWRNTGSGFVLYASLSPVSYSSVAVGDFNNDGLLDIVFTGINGGAFLTEVWTNTGSGFSYYQGLPGTVFGAVAVADFDNDGLPDILLAGLSPGGDITQVWHNTGTGFTNVNTSLPGIERCSIAVGDYDNDGRPDILLTGSPVGTQLWRNTGNGFSYVDVSLPFGGSLAWGDFDNDGRLDILASAGGVWRNTGTNFTLYAGLPIRVNGSAVCGDLDGDGKLDILLAGDDGSYNFHSQVWLNTGTGFAPCPETLGLHYSSAAFGDFDNDGRLDLLLSGLTANSSVFVTQLWRNVSTPSNSLPTAPSGLASAISPSAFTLKWNTASDSETATPGLSYNLRVGTTPGGSDIIAPMADVNGNRRLAQRGAIQSPQIGLQLPPSIVPGTRLYWSVQSIDSSFAGSPFAPETSVVVQPFFDSWSRRGDGAFQAQFKVQGGTNYTIQASTDMVHWSDVFDFTFGTTGPVLFTDPTATNYPIRFYRFGQY